MNVASRRRQEPKSVAGNRKRAKFSSLIPRSRSSEKMPRGMFSKSTFGFGVPSCLDLAAHTARPLQGPSRHPDQCGRQRRGKTVAVNFLWKVDTVDAIDSCQSIRSGSIPLKKFADSPTAGSGAVATYNKVISERPYRISRRKQKRRLLAHGQKQSEGFRRPAGRLVQRNMRSTR